MHFAFLPPLSCRSSSLLPSSTHLSTTRPTPSSTTHRRVSSITMNEPSNLKNRRQLLVQGLTTLAGLTFLSKSANAKSGDSPTISIFGVGGQSSPFTKGVQKGGKTLYKPYSKDELEVYTRIIQESKDRLDGAEYAIRDKSWEDVRSRIRLEMSDLRKVQMNLNQNLQDTKERSNAEKMYQKFKQDIEALDYAASTKDQSRAYKAWNSASQNLKQWRKLVGF